MQVRPLFIIGEPRSGTTLLHRTLGADTERFIAVNADELEASIDFLQIDFLDENKWKSLTECDIIVSNPPYIPIKEKEGLGKNVTDFEPELALFVEDKDPFIFYKKIAKFSKTHLKKRGKIYVEINETSAQEIKQVFEKEGFNAVIKKDIYRKERMIKAVKSGD